MRRRALMRRRPLFAVVLRRIEAALRAASAAFAARRVARTWRKGASTSRADGCRVRSFDAHATSSCLCDGCDHLFCSVCVSRRAGGGLSGGGGGKATAAEEEKPFGIGGDLAVVAPVGDLADGTGPLVGPSFRAGYHVIPNLEIGGRVGFLYGIEKSAGMAESSVSAVPVLFGARYFFHGSVRRALRGRSRGDERPHGGRHPRRGLGLSDGDARWLRGRLRLGHFAQGPRRCGAEAESLQPLLGTEDREGALLGVGVCAGYQAQL